MSHVVVAYPGNEALAASLATATGASVVRLEHREFPDGEIYLRVDGGVDGKSVIVACGLERANGKALGTYLLASTLRDLGARRIVLAAPYLGYMRQDRSFRAGEGVSARYFANFLSTFLDGLVTVDPHLHRIGDLADVYSIPTRTVAAAPAISSWIAQNIDAPILIGPDSESKQWVSEVATGARCPFVVLAKKRHGDRDVEITVPNLGKPTDRTPVLVDDIVSTARTMIVATRHVIQAGHRPPVCVGVHAIFAGSAYEELKNAGAAQIVTCNTIPHPTNAIDVHPAFAHAVLEMSRLPAGQPN